MTVLEELDAGKKGMSEVSRNVRETNRLIDQIISNASFDDIKAGLDLERIHPNKESETLHLGKLFFETEPLIASLPESLPSHKADNHILQTGLALKEHYPNRNVTLVTKDINMRIKSRRSGCTPKIITTTGFWKTPTYCSLAGKFCRSTFSKKISAK